MESRSDNPRLAITVAGYPFDRVEGLGGKVPVAGCDVRFEYASIGDMNSHVFSGPRTREVTEIGLLPYLLAYTNDDFRDYTLIPVFPLRLFRHKSIFVRTDRGIERPEDLRGKRVGTSGYSTTSLTWIRGMLEHEYGVKPEDVRWIISDEDSSADLAGRRSEQEQMLPDGLDVSYGTAGKSESDLLVDGEVDALFHAAEPKAFVDGHPLVGRLFTASREAERAYFARTGIFPIMHAVAIRTDVAEANPWLPKAIFRAYATAKEQALQRLRTTGWAMISLPWLSQEVEATRELMGDNFWPYGIKDNRDTLSALLQYSHEQGLTERMIPPEELFHASTLELIEAPSEARG
jgi:4,5-dihydroxyphthalate decarboxylase